MKTGERKVLIESATDPRYLETGHLIYGHDSTILAVPFDPKRLEVTGGPVSVVEGVSQSTPTGAVQFAISQSGSLAFVPGTTSDNRTMVWVDRHGMETPVQLAPARPFAQPRISADGTRAAMEINDQEQAIWVWEFPRGTLTRLTFGRGVDWRPQWTPDGRRIVYSSAIDGERGIYVRPFPEVDKGRWQVSTTGGVVPRWSRNGRELFFADRNNNLVGVAVRTRKRSFRADSRL